MSYTTWETIAETPWWVFFSMLFILLAGFSATKPRYIQLKPELTFQALSLFLMSVIVCYYVSFSLIHFCQFAVSLILGGLFGWTHFRIRKFHAVKNYFALYVPGSWIPFSLIFCLIVAKLWYFGLSYSINFDVLYSNEFQSYLVMAAGLSLGLFFGRTKMMLQRIKTGPFVDAPE